MSILTIHMRSLPSAELKLLHANFSNSETTFRADTTALAVPPEELLYKNLKPKSHFVSLCNQLQFMMQPELRREPESYISHQAAIAGYKTLVASNLQKASNLAVANLYWYFKVRDEAEDEAVTA